MNQTTESIMKDCFLSTSPCLHQHVHTLLTNKDAYLQTVETLCAKKIVSTLSQAVKARTIAALHIANQHKVLTKFLKHCEVVEITKAVLMLDLPRHIRQIEKKIAVIEKEHPHLKTDVEKEANGVTEVDKEKETTDEESKPRKRRKRQIDVLRRQLNELQKQADVSHKENDGCAAAHADTAVQELITSASVSGALARKIRKWAKQNLTQDFLEFVVLTMPMENWKKLADLVHFKPSDFALPYFLSAAHGEPLPEDSFVHGLRTLIEAPSDQLASQFRSLASRHPQIFLSYNFLRTHSRLLQQKEIAESLAQHIPLSTAIWYLEELAQASREIPEIVGNRLLNEDWMREDSKVTASFGKLLERIMTFQSRKWPLADALMDAARSRLEALKEIWSEESSGFTVVFGDASSSMQSAIEAATILATMVSVCWRAELCFFHSEYQASPYPRPSTVEHTLKICRKIRATGCTSIAAALWPYLDKKIKVDRIVLVTDEGENTNCHGYMFARLLKEYKEQINPEVELIIVCVDNGCSWFRETLSDNGIDYKRVEIDGRRPDLTKFDAMLGQIAMASKKVEDGKKEEKDTDFVML